LSDSLELRSVTYVWNSRHSALDKYPGFFEIMGPYTYNASF
jgi:hypothetical protein